MRLFYSLFLYILIFPVSADVPRTIIKLDAGVYYYDKIELKGPHSLLQGAGRGLTTVVVNDGVQAIDANPIIRDISIIGKGHGTGLHLENTWSAIVSDIEIENFSTGILLELNDNARKRRPTLDTMKSWPDSLTKDKVWGSRVTLTEIRNVDIVGPGNGIVLKNSLKDSLNKGDYWGPTQERRHGEFFTGTNIISGHIYVQGNPLVIGDGVDVTKVIATYIDINKGDGVVVEYGAKEVDLIGVTLDLNKNARESNTPKFTISKKANRQVRMNAIQIEKKHIKIVRP